MIKELIDWYFLYLYVEPEFTQEQKEELALSVDLAQGVFWIYLDVLGDINLEKLVVCKRLGALLSKSKSYKKALWYRYSKVSYPGSWPHDTFS